MCYEIYIWSSPSILLQDTFSSILLGLSGSRIEQIHLQLFYKNDSVILLTEVLFLFSLDLNYLKSQELLSTNNSVVSQQYGKGII